MGAGTLESAVFNFAELTRNLPDHELDREWVWGDYAVAALDIQCPGTG